MCAAQIVPGTPISIGTNGAQQEAPVASDLRLGVVVAGVTGTLVVESGGLSPGTGLLGLFNRTCTIKRDSVTGIQGGKKIVTPVTVLSNVPCRINVKRQVDVIDGKQVVTERHKLFTEAIDIRARDTVIMDNNDSFTAPQGPRRQDGALNPHHFETMLDIETSGDN